MDHPVFRHPWWVVVWFIDGLRNHLIAGWRTTSCKWRAHDSSDKNHNHNSIESFSISPCRRISKGESIWRATHSLEQILQPILELRPGCLRHRLVIHAGYARPHTARKSQELCKQNPLRTAAHPPCSPDREASLSPFTSQLLNGGTWAICIQLLHLTFSQFLGQPSTCHLKRFLVRLNNWTDYNIRQSYISFVLLVHRHSARSTSRAFQSSACLDNLYFVLSVFY
jgi:hypothetical protein